MTTRGIMPVLLVIMLGLMGCVAEPVSTVTPESQAKQRAVQYWQLVAEASFKEIYDGFLCEETRNEIPFREFVSIAARIPYEGVTVESAELAEDGTRALVRAKFNMAYNQYDLRGLTLKQDWFWENGNWFLKIDTNRNPFKE